MLSLKNLAHREMPGGNLRGFGRGPCFPRMRHAGDLWPCRVIGASIIRSPLGRMMRVVAGCINYGSVASWVTLKFSARLTKSGSFLPLCTRRGPWFQVLVPRSLAPRFGKLRSPSGHAGDLWSSENASVVGMAHEIDDRLNFGRPKFFHRT